MESRGIDGNIPRFFHDPERTLSPSVSLAKIRYAHFLFAKFNRTVYPNLGRIEGTADFLAVP
jgi:hypothetical protein